ncbi:ribosome biogenesis/translation initiation ATPase RLI [Candidatus Woesearchaeota archaeon]|nr:ribosome biogenesis/translation initiation ATPase RLI [Candidatus Woesearchaeota archaeon]MBW3013645.1 ribosome biogenesis/translation initiation ATPase RLI [Candidatus Woesearchaeota archaeon]
MTRIAVLNKNTCKNKIDCPFICGSVCPVNRASKECIIVESDNKAFINEELCIGCGICVKQCPFDCIKIINLPEQLKTDPIHRYGGNGFALYSLPTPMFGKVVGIVGVNGIGKSTAIQILAGMLKPNFGKFGKEFSYQDLIDYFKGTEAQNFFEKVKAGKIKIAYKPQAVDQIPKVTKGKVRDLLKKVDEKNQMSEIAEKLEITNILNHDLGKISGGELQRVAIAATVLKDANLYIFDEMTSYLDIKQRLKLAKFIKELATEDIAVLVIEHDLIALDYISDLVHIMYGQPGGFGVVSNLRSTKTAINVYLEGYMKEENVRFRDHKIKFEVRPPVETKKENLLTEWPEMKKKLGSFSLAVQPGDIMKGELCGILGENGIGKTTFVKMLAGVEKPDSGNIDSSIKIAYKPQYLETGSEDLVMLFLQNAIKKHNNDIVMPLNIQPLLMKQLRQLSGGELQRVSIAKALAEDADLVLLDEPSAYLDVEQRLSISKIIASVAETKGMAVLVVDHDLLFLDYLSERLLVFNGIPAKNGLTNGPMQMEEGMNMLLKDLDITLRRDDLSGRPRINKPGSQKDREQKSKGKYYYS